MPFFLVKKVNHKRDLLQSHLFIGIHSQILPDMRCNLASTINMTTKDQNRRHINNSSTNSNSNSNHHFIPSRVLTCSVGILHSSINPIHCLFAIELETQAIHFTGNWKTLTHKQGTRAKKPHRMPSNSVFTQLAHFSNHRFNRNSLSVIDEPDTSSTYVGDIDASVFVQLRQNLSR